MDFPKDKLDYTTTHRAETSSGGWLILNVHNIDLDGVNKIYINLDDVESVKQRRAKSESEAERVKRLLGG